LQPLGPPGRLTERVGQALAGGLLADPGLHAAFDSALPPNYQALLTTREDPEQAIWPTVELPPLADAAMTASSLLRLSSILRSRLM